MRQKESVKDLFGVAYVTSEGVYGTIERCLFMIDLEGFMTLQKGCMGR